MILRDLKINQAEMAGTVIKSLKNLKKNQIFLKIQNTAPEERKAPKWRTDQRSDDKSDRKERFEKAPGSKI